MTVVLRHFAFSLILLFIFMLSVIRGNAQENVLDVSGAARVLITETPAVQQNFTEMTIECWIKPSRIFNNYAMAVHRNTKDTTIGASLWFIGFDNTGNLVVTINAVHPSGAWQNGQTSVQPAADEWHHVAGTWNGTNGYVYLNGVEIHSYASNPMSANTAKEDAFAFGATGIGAAAYQYDGLISEVRLWSVKRSEAEIQATMNSRLTGMEYGLVGYWPINEGAGTQTDDYTGNESHGTLDGAAAWVVANDLELAPADADYIISAPFTVADKQTGNTDFTNSNEVDVVDFPVPDGFDLYQFTEGGDISSINHAGWIATSSTPAELSFTEPGADEDVIRYAWFTNSSESAIMRRASDEIRYTTALPAPSVKATYSRGKAPDQNVVVYPWEIDDGSTGGTTGVEEIPIRSLYLRVESGPGADVTPEEPFVTVSATGTYNVTLTVTNVAGSAATSTACELTVEAIESNTFVWEGSVNNDWFEPLNWDLQAVPFDGAEVIINGGADILLSAPSAELASLDMFGGTLTFTNWDTSLNASDIVVQAGAVLTTPAVDVDTATSNRVYVICENFTLEEGGEINVDAKGYGGGWNSDGQGPGIGFAAGHGGRGGDDFPSHRGGPVYGDASAPIGPGSGGKSTDARAGHQAGNGGGSVRINATGNVRIDGVITADGGAGAGYSAAGSAGAIWINCLTFEGDGVLRAEGNEGPSRPWGGSGGGRIAVIYDAVAQAELPVPDALFSVRGGLTPAGGRTRDGDIGTLYFTDTQFITPVMRYSGQLVFASEPTELIFDSLTLTNAWLRFNDGLEQFSVEGDLVVDGASARLDIGGSGYYTDCGAWHLLNTAPQSTVVNIGGNVSLTNGGAMFMYPSYAEVMQLDVNGAMFISSGSVFSPYCNPTNGMGVFTSCRNLVIFENGGINAFGLGFAGGRHSEGLGPGGARYGGGGYGGVGGASTSTRPGGPVYGDPEQPVFPGSGGGSWDARVENYGGYGGGFLRFVVAEKFVLDGFVDASAGVAGSGYNSAGSGGGIYIETRSFSGSAVGLLKADGGERTNLGGGGGGGRIAVWYGDLKTETTPPHRIIVSETPPETFQGSTSVLGGPGYYEAGEDGTVRFIQVLYPQGSFFSSF